MNRFCNILFLGIILSPLFWKGAELHAQNNLVPNWSFENITQCPVYSNNIATETYAIPWANPNNETPDLFSTCNTQPCSPGNPPCTGVPFNVWGFQKPHTGTNYSGMLIYQIPQHFLTNVREYIQVKLADSLKAKKKYCMSFYTSLANSSYYATSRVGCYISKGAVTNFSQDLISETPQIQSPFHQYLTDTLNWIQIQGQYTAIGGENYITIGNFYDDTNTDSLVVNPAFKDYASYYYVDDVSLHEMQINAGPDTTSCAGQLTTIGEVNTDSSFNSYYWYAANGTLLDSLHSTLNVSPTINTQYILEKRMCGQSLFDTLKVSVKPVPQVTISITGNKSYLCIQDTMQLTAILNNSNATWAYSWQPAQYINNTGILNPNVYPQTTSIYTLSIQNTDTNFCKFKDTASISIQVKPYAKATLQINSNKNFICLNTNEQVSLSAIVNNSNSTWNYNWQPAAALNNAANVSVSTNMGLQSSTVFTLSIQSTDTNLCRINYTDTIRITVLDCSIHIPNIFSPNGDGINDTWQLITGTNEVALLTSLQCTIYDSWGIKVFDSSTSSGIATGWDGHTTSGEACSAGTYFYIMDYTDILGNNTKAKGFLELLR